MGFKDSKTPNPVVGPLDQTETLARNGRSAIGEREMIDNVGFDDVSNLTATQIPLPTTDVEMEVVSSSPSDSGAGSGARTVLIIALGSDLTEKFNIIELSGTTPIPIVSNMGSGVRRINTFIVQSVGTERGFAAGTIVIRDKNNPATIYSQIDPGENTSHSALRTIPVNTVGVFLGWYAGAWTTSKTMHFRFQTSFNSETNEVTPGVFITRDELTMRNSQINITFPTPLMLPGGTDMIVNAQIFEGGNGYAVSNFQYIIQRS